MLKWLLMLCGISTAHAQSFLTQTDYPTCLSRSQAQCQALGCDGVNTIYWWNCQKLTNGQAAIVVDPSGPFGPTTSSLTTATAGLKPAEQSGLKNTTQLGTALPYVISIVPFRARFTAGQIAAIVASTDTVVTSGWNAINGAATVNVTSPSTIATVQKMAIDGLIPASSVQTILAPVATP